jgi:hypothetical protein
LRNENKPVFSDRWKWHKTHPLVFRAWLFNFITTGLKVSDILTMVFKKIKTMKYLSIT